MKKTHRVTIISKRGLLSLPRRKAGGMPARVVAGLVLLSLIALTVAPSGQALAHANLVRSLPPAGAVLDAAPAQVQLWFSEPPELRFSELQVVDVQGARVDRRDSRVAPDDSSSLIVGLLRPGLPNGTYLIIWRVVSTVDGHATRGAVPFAVGVSPDGVLAPPQQGVEGYSKGSTAAEVLFRWVMLAGLLVASGAFAFAVLVWRGALRAVLAARPVPSGLNGVSTWQARLVLIGTLLALVGSLGLLAVQAARAGGGFGAALGNVLGETRLGYAWWARAALLAFAGAIAWRWAGRPGERRLPQAGLVAMALALLTVSVVGHGAAAFRWVWAAVLGDWLHLMAVGAWAGGLPSLLLSVVVVARRTEGVQRARLLAMLVSGFSDVALIAVAVVALTGVFSAYLHVGGFAGVASSYGATLVVKTALFLGVLAAAGVNLLVVRPRLRALAAERAPSTFPKTLGLLRRALVAEVALVACIVAASALLTSLDTARRPEGPGNQGRVAVFQRQSGDLALSLQIAYIGGGQHRLTLQAKDRSGAVTDLDRAVVRVTYLVRDVGESEVVLQRLGDEYAAQGLLLPLAGAWQLELMPLRPGPTAAPERFQVTVVASGLVYPALAETAQAPPNRAVPLALAGALLLVALAAVFRSGMLPRRKRRQAAAMVAGGLCAGVVGMAALVGQVSAIRSGESIPLVNPFPATPQSVAAGEALYRQHCLACHGPSGHGDGPAAAGLSPPPADLPVHVPLHGDRQLFVWVSNGLPGTAMPAFRDKLTAEERWRLLNYLKSFTPQDR